MKVQEKYFDPAIQASMKEKIHPLLEKISDDSDRRLVDEFWVKAAQYLGVIYGIDAAFESDNADLESASEIAIKETRAILKEGKKLEDAINNEELIKKIKKFFRECVIPLGIKSKIVKHAFLKPSGFAGDFRIIEIIYDNQVLSKGTGYCGDKIFLNDDYAVAVRNRKDAMKAILTRFTKNSDMPSLDILNIACGSCREIKEMFDECAFDISKKMTFSLMDQDREALDFSLSILKNSPPNVEYRTLCNSVYDYVKNPDAFRDNLSGKDLVYTIGLADYIPEATLKSLIVFLFSLLKPGGKLIIAHKDSKNFSPLAPDWLCDWTFQLRNEPEVVELIRSSGISDFNLTINRNDTTKIIFFAIIEKINK